MADPPREAPEGEPGAIVVPREKAVFWLDRRGRWRNAHGVFRNPRISAHFHRSIRRDAGGYYVGQRHGARLEKVYFPYEDTALFVREVRIGEEIRLRLNTGAEIPLDPPSLFVSGEALYLTHEGERIRFTEEAMVQLSPLMSFSGEGFFLETRMSRHRIPELPAAADAETAGENA
ncbi:MAG: MFS transporter permease [Desulfobacterales bacterium]